VREAAELPFVRVFVLGVSGLRGGAAGYELEEMVSSWLADGGDRAVQSHGRRAFLRAGWRPSRPLSDLADRISRT